MRMQRRIDAGGGARSPTRLLVLLAILLVGAVCGSDRAVAQSGIDSCSIADSSIAFSPYSPVTKAAVDSTGDLTVTCTGRTSDNVTLELTAGSGNCNQRQMNSAKDKLHYQVYSDSARTTVWCGSQRVIIPVSFTNGTFTRTLPMYGRVASGQNVTPGSYSDTFTALALWGSHTSAPANITVTGSVSSTCTLSTTGMDFGTYSAATGTTGTATAAVTCTNGTSYTVGINGGLNQSGSSRQMAGPNSGRLAYELFSDSVRTVPWGDGTALGSTVAGTGSGNTQNLTVYGRIPAGQTLAPVGQYSDSVIVTVTY